MCPFIVVAVILSSNRRLVRPEAVHWTLDPAGCDLRLEFPETGLRSLALGGARGWVELRTDALEGSRFSVRLQPQATRHEDEVLPFGFAFQGSAMQLGPDGETLVAGRLRLGDRVQSLTVAVTPTGHHQHGDTEVLELEAHSLLPPSDCGASRVEGRLRFWRTSSAA